MSNKKITLRLHQDLKNREVQIIKDVEELNREKYVIRTLLQLYIGKASDGTPKIPNVAKKKIVIDELASNDKESTDQREDTEEVVGQPDIKKPVRKNRRKKLDIKTVAAIKAELNEGKISEKKLIEKYDTNSGTIWRIKTERMHKDVAPAAMTPLEAEKKMVEKNDERERESHSNNQFFESLPQVKKHE